MEVYKEGRERLKSIYQQKGGNEEFGRKVNQDVIGYLKLFWKEVR